MIISVSDEGAVEKDGDDNARRVGDTEIKKL